MYVYDEFMTKKIFLPPCEGKIGGDIGGKGWRVALLHRNGSHRIIVQVGEKFGDEDLKCRFRGIWRQLVKAAYDGFDMEI